ncbi:hypothetical protein CBR_g81575 [Chara braunii]|uniref:Reverse transcriptase domain-containing protein n=1 Tax=Chara braunii TaxID=69332 RepID=A0A388KAS9_CHABU|nr:hypothetical protein CBR_g81575 [Chara braunii]|eukprot:GBG67150.1 hypothetical protein CBR_g81575 [Chara braunii]
MLRKYRLGDGLLTIQDLEGMNKDDFTTIGAFVQEFKKKARKVHGISEERQCAIFLGLLTGSEAAELTSHGGGSAKLTWATIDRGVEDGSLDQVEQHQMRQQRRKRKERDPTASGTPGLKRVVTDVLAELGYGQDAETQRKAVAVVQGRGKEVGDEGAGQEDYGGEETGRGAYLSASWREERACDGTGANDRPTFFRGRLKQGAQRRYKTVDKKCRPVPVLVTEDEEAYYERERGLIRRMQEQALKDPCRINDGNEEKLIVGEPGFLSLQERALMVQLMKKRHRAYAFNDDQRGRLDVDKIPMIRIHTVPHEPWNLRGARYPNPDEEKMVVDYLDGKMRTHVAGYSSGPYACPWFCFIKPNGTLRWVQDLQRLNAVTVRDAGGLPNADALSESCAGRPIISLIDLYSGYDQFHVYPPDRPVTAMHTPRGLIHMNVAPQGWTNAVAIVQRHMIRAMQTISPHITQPYIDDLAVKGPKEREEDEVQPGVRRFVWRHIQDLDRVLGLLEEHNLTASWPKSKHCMREATILGFLCNERGRKPDVKKTDKILEWPVPFQTITDVRSFLGTCGFWRSFVKDFAAKTEHLRKLVRQDQEWVWGKDQEEAVTRMKGGSRREGTHGLVEEVRTIEEGPTQVEEHEQLMGGMYLLTNTLLQGDFDRRGSFSHEENEILIPESQDNEFEEGEIKEAFRAEEYDGIYLKLGLLLSCEMRDRDASDKAEKMRHLYMVRDEHLFIKRQVGNPKRIVCERNRQLDIIAALHDGIAGGHRGVEFHQVTEGDLLGPSSQAPEQRESEVPATPFGSPEAHLDASQWEAPSAGESPTDPSGGGQTRPEPETGPLRLKMVGAKDVIVVGGDTPPDSPARAQTRRSWPEGVAELDNQEAPVPPPEATMSPRQEVEARGPVEGWRTEPRLVVDSRLAAHAAEHPDIEEPSLVGPSSGPAGAELGEGSQTATGEVAEAGTGKEPDKPAQAKRARVRARLEEIHERRDRMEAAGIAPRPPVAPKTSEERIDELWARYEGWREAARQRAREASQAIEGADEAIEVGELGFAATRKAIEWVDKEIKQTSIEAFQRYSLLSDQLALRKDEVEQLTAQLAEERAENKARQTRLEAKEAEWEAKLKEMAASVERLAATKEAATSADAPMEALAQEPQPASVGEGEAEESLAILLDVQEGTLTGAMEPPRLEAQGEEPSRLDELVAAMEVDMPPEEPREQRTSEHELEMGELRAQLGSWATETDSGGPTTEQWQQEATSQPTRATTPQALRPCEKEKGAILKVTREGWPLRSDTPEYQPEREMQQGDSSAHGIEGEAEGPWHLPQSHEVSKEKEEEPPSPGTQKKKKRFQRKSGVMCFYFLDGAHRALECPKFLKNKDEGLVTEEDGKMYDRQGRVVKRAPDGGRAQQYRQNQEEMSE